MKKKKNHAVDEELEESLPPSEEEEITPPAEGEESGCAAAEKTESVCDAGCAAAEKKKPKPPLIRRITGIVGYLIIGALVVIIALVFVSNMQGKATFVFGYTTMWVRTESMEPTIPARSYILVQKIDPAQVAVGDVIVFSSDDPDLNGANNTHRVIEILNGGTEFRTQGDNKMTNPGADKYTAKSEKVVGRYVRNLPVLTTFGRVMSTSTGMMITFTIIFAIFVAIYVPDMIRASKRREAEAARIEQERMDALVALEIEKLKAADAAKKAEAEAAGHPGTPAQPQCDESSAPETDPGDREEEPSSRDGSDENAE